MTPLGPEALALIAEARDGDEPTCEDQERIEAAIAARLATGAAVGLVAAAVARSSVSGARTFLGTNGFAWSTSKVLIWLTALGSIGASMAIFAHAPHRGAAIASPTTDRPALVVSQAPAHREELSGRASVGPSVISIPSDVGTVSASAVRAVPGPLALASAASAKRGTSPTADVAAEVLLIGEAHAAMRNGQAGRALALLDEHSRRFPNGALGEERDAARVAALCALGRTVEAQAAADRFLRVSPLSPHAARVRASCGGSSAVPASSF